mmetsp:Transcript_6165/g.15750  ORF Transcript_6165/g.15750 Transcript_6165/m.15750 type:complete len:81 (+) Transcript_6165:164-406(+)|eukprot:CAMPEP_0168786706 /NCGR_PEP_ID=MMETSP0725-20121227/11415_1 /TAXON_ID=265536 /ORGANISM="Amphiprora sp., Strain CCMP467" /LENGTH=80 /DNA_ID=CAMNT_0008836873 /DNA_START=182 /DNA_END=424 /DNA_ORIENTATION=+
MPRLETLLMQKYHLHYAEVRTVCAEEREKLGMSKNSAMTQELHEACAVRCEALTGCSSTAFHFPAKGTPEEPTKVVPKAA